ncbi:hypothetical protein [Falsiroseomonas sp. HW251]|uniref:hypothetical protein n=1 Tax=Falsiroseomonas sp. HW251 TaxID=3390998 RepID=UPI003D31DE1B
MFKGILTGLSCGAAVALVLHGVALAFEETAARQGVFLRQNFAVFPLEPWVRVGAPLFLDRMLSGAFWGAAIGLLVYSGRMPHRMTGFLFAAVVCTAIGYSVVIDSTVGQSFRFSLVNSGALGAQIMVNAAWGYLTGVMMLFTDALRMSLRNDLHSAQGTAIF